MAEEMNIPTVHPSEGYLNTRQRIEDLFNGFVQALGEIEESVRADERERCAKIVERASFSFDLPLAEKVARIASCIRGGK